MIRGRVIKYGDDVDTDVIIPARYLKHGSDPKVLSEHAMEDLDPEFKEKVKKRNIIVAGKNFGYGSSREQAPLALKYAGVKVILAESFARIFFRNAINIGLPLMEVKGVSKIVDDGDVVEVHLEEGRVRIPSKGAELSGTKLPEFLMEILKAGGLVPYLRRRLHAENSDNSG
ncbi:MAG: 3-isopropylmalate dehydratase small subunit [Candidatus Korarchaeota archaeon]|nr:3-isopropylmalate dehydratase small subunit [Candidatus Korarchaeota archaeon]